MYIRSQHTCNTLLGPVLQTDTVVLTVIDLFLGGATVKESFLLAWNCLGEMTEAIPLATLFFFKTINFQSP